MWTIARQFVVAIAGSLIDKWLEHRRRKQAEQERLSLIAEKAREEGRIRAEIAEKHIQAAADSARASSDDPLLW